MQKLTRQLQQERLAAGCSQVVGSPAGVQPSHVARDCLQREGVERLDDAQRAVGLHHFALGRFFFIFKIFFYPVEVLIFSQDWITFFYLPAYFLYL